MKQVIVSRNNNEEVLVQTPTGKILAECFFKAEDETPDELRQMGYRSLTEQYRRAHIIVGAGLEAADLAELLAPLRCQLTVSTKTSGDGTMVIEASSP
jgi:hypothetical protein